MRRLRSLGAAVVACVVWIGASAAPGPAYTRPSVLEQIDLAPRGAQPSCENCGLSFPSVSDDGRYVAFDSGAVDLVPADTNGVSDIFRRDRKTGRVVRVSLTWRGAQATTLPLGRGSHSASISRDGRFIAFVSDATNLVPGDVNGHADVFVRDMKQRITYMASLTALGEIPRYDTLTLPWQGAQGASISDDGRFIVFSSVATNMTRIDCTLNRDQGCSSVYLHDRRSGKTALVSKAATDNARAEAYSASISGNGRYVAFHSVEATLVEGDTNNAQDVFVYDVKRKKLERISLKSDGTQADQPLTEPSAWRLGGIEDATLSRDGRFVVFNSYLSDLVPSDTNYSPVSAIRFGWDVFVHDRVTRRIQRASVRPTGMEFGTSSVNPRISPDGRFVAFSLIAEGSTLLTSGGFHVYVHDLRTGATDLVPPKEFDDRCATLYPSLSLGGRFVAMQSCSLNPDEKKDPHNSWHPILADRGAPLGAQGATGGRARITVVNEPSFIRTGLLMRSDATGDVAGGGPEADLVGARLAYRPRYGDLFAAIDVAEMKSASVGPRALAVPPPAIVYGLSFSTDGRRYEVRAQRSGTSSSRLDGALGLFRCRRGILACVKVADLEGGYGTTGESVVASIPLAELGIPDGGNLSRVRAFSAMGLYDHPLQIRRRQILDRVGFAPRGA